MFEIHSCSHPDCPKQALSSFDAEGRMVAQLPGFCLEHSPNPEEAVQAIYRYIQNNDKIIALSAPYIPFNNLDLSDKKFYGCNFQHATFSTVHSEKCRMRICILDFSTFCDCNLIRSNMQYTSFAGCNFSHILFTESDLVHNNFNGITAHQSSFDDSDLYNSRFIRATLIDTSIRNCNIKNTIFYYMTQQNVSFKSSNTREAYFALSGPEL